VPRLILAGVTPDNTPGGYYYTFLFPMVLFIVVAVILYVLFTRPHRRVPGEPISAATGAHLQASGRVGVQVGGQVSGAELADAASDETPADTDAADADAAVSGEDQGATE
jgi:uncharacterized protein (DUF58 family)